MGGQTVYRMGDFESVTNAKYKLVANHEQRFISVQENKDTVKGTYLMDGELEKLLKGKEVVKVEAVGKDELLLNMALNIPEAEWLAMVVDRKTYLIKKMVVYYRNAVALKAEAGASGEKSKPRMEIVYAYDLHPKWAKDAFSVSKYVDIGKGGARLKTAYKGYELMDYIK